MEDHRFTLLSDQHSVDATVADIPVEKRLWLETLVGETTGKKLIAFGTWKTYGQSKFYIVPEEIIPEITYG